MIRAVWKKWLGAVVATALLPPAAGAQARRI